MYIMDSNKYAIELVTYLLVLVAYFYELIVYMLLERNAFDSIECFLSEVKSIKVAFTISNGNNSKLKKNIFHCIIS